MKNIFSLIGVAGTIWVGYILLRNSTLNQGIAELNGRLFGNLSTAFSTKEKPVVFIADNTKPTMMDDSGMVPKPAMKVINDLDWGLNKKSTSEDMFTQEGRLANAGWGNKEIIA